MSNNKIDQYFKSYPKNNEVHQTSDEYLFHTQNHAQNHARILKDKAVKSFKRGTANVQEATAPAEALIGSVEDGAENVQADNNSNTDKEPDADGTTPGDTGAPDADGKDADTGNGDAANGEAKQPVKGKKATEDKQ